MSKLSTMILLHPKNYRRNARTEIAPGVFIPQECEAAFEAALETDPDFQAEYSAILYNLDAYSMTDEVAPEIEDTYAPIIQHVRFRQLVASGDPTAQAVVRACDPTRVRRSIAPFALRLGSR